LEPECGPQTDTAPLITEIHAAALECDQLWHESEAASEQMRLVAQRREAAKLRLLKAQRALLLALVGHEAMVP
jgi:hypothetical protein